jgi:hypothetical protein
MERAMNMVEREQEVRERMEAAGITPLKSEEREIKCEFTEVEMTRMGVEIDKLIAEALRLEEEKKAVTKKLKDLQDEAESSFRALSRMRSLGFEDRDKLVVVGIDLPNKRRIVVDVETGLQLCTEMLQDSDLQTSMKLKTNKAKKAPAEPKAPAPLEIGMDNHKKTKNAVDVGDVTLNGEEIEEGVIVDADEAPKISEIVTQVWMLETQEQAAPGFVFMTSAENLVFFTNDKEQIAILEAVKAGRGYVAIEYLDVKDAMNKQILKLQVRDLSPTIDPDSDPSEEIPLEHGLEEGDGID